MSSSSSSSLPAGSTLSPATQSQGHSHSGPHSSAQHANAKLVSRRTSKYAAGDKPLKVETVCEGYLEKKSPRSVLGRHAWQKRYFVLTITSFQSGALRYTLYYYRSAEERNAPLGLIEIDGIKAVNISTEKNGRFDVVVEGRTYSLRTDSSADLKKWTDVLADVKEKEKRLSKKMEGLPDNAFDTMKMMASATPATAKLFATDDAIEVLSMGVACKKYDWAKDGDAEVSVIMLWYQKAKGPLGTLFYNEPGVPTEEESKSIPLNELSDLFIGKHSKMFKTATGSKANGHCVFTIATKSKEWNCEVDSKEQIASILYTINTIMVAQGGRKVVSAEDQKPHTPSKASSPTSAVSTNGSTSPSSTSADHSTASNTKDSAAIALPVTVTPASPVSPSPAVAMAAAASPNVSANSAPAKSNALTVDIPSASASRSPSNGSPKSGAVDSANAPSSAVSEGDEGPIHPASPRFVTEDGTEETAAAAAGDVVRIRPNKPKQAASASAASPAASAALAPMKPKAAESEVGVWLLEMGSAYSAYVDTFYDNGVNMQFLLTLTDDDLQELGVSSSLHRKKILHNVEEMKERTLITSSGNASPMPKSPLSGTRRLDLDGNLVPMAPMFDIPMPPDAPDAPVPNGASALERVKASGFMLGIGPHSLSALRSVSPDARQAVAADKMTDLLAEMKNTKLKSGMARSAKEGPKKEILEDPAAGTIAQIALKMAQARKKKEEDAKKKKDDDDGTGTNTPAEPATATATAADSAATPATNTDLRPTDTLSQSASTSAAASAGAENADSPAVPLVEGS